MIIGKTPKELAIIGGTLAAMFFAGYGVGALAARLAQLIAG